MGKDLYENGFNPASWLPIANIIGTTLPMF